MSEHTSSVRPAGVAEPESLAELRGDCALMAPHWTRADAPAPAAVSPARIRGVRVPSSAAALLDGMSGYGG